MLSVGGEGIFRRFRGDQGYSWAGICCSTSRQALIFSRRHTQQRGSAEPEAVSEPHTMHFSGVRSRSVARERFAPSRISGCITGCCFESPARFESRFGFEAGGLLGNFRFIGTSTMSDQEARPQPGGYRVDAAGVANLVGTSQQVSNLPWCCVSEAPSPSPDAGR